MSRSQFDTTWISHSSMSDFLKCPKLYYYRSVHKEWLTIRGVLFFSKTPGRLNCNGNSNIFLRYDQVEILLK